MRGRLPDACPHKPGLAVWLLTERLEQFYRPFLTLGPIRLTNTTGRRVFDRIRVIDRILLLQDDPCGRLCLQGDPADRMFGEHGFWQIQGVGAFRGVLIGRAKDATAIEQVWRGKGIGLRCGVGSSGVHRSGGSAFRSCGSCGSPGYFGATVTAW